MSTIEQPAPMSDTELDEVDREFNARTLSALIGERLSSHTRTHLLKRACELVPRMAAEMRALRTPVDVEAEVRQLLQDTLLHKGDHISDSIRWGLTQALERTARLQRDNGVLRGWVERLDDGLKNEARMYAAASEENARLQREAEGLRAGLATAFDPVDGLEAKLVERTAERDDARAWVRRLTATTRVLTCAFCGEAYPPGTPDSNDAALLAHVHICAKHPMREVEAERDTARAEIERLKATASAWKALAQAHRRVDEARTSEEQDAACDAVVAAVDALRALGIDPEA